ncbi:MAG: 50S ribosomal protein L11 [Proteobacteria bacterium]|nr:50S ribosomal protein L11 [Pseudomonadota bacterium]
MAKKIEGTLSLQAPAGAATPSPPIGPALGQRGLNIMEFCRTFNALTEKMEKGVPIPTVITIYSDKTFSVAVKKPTASHYIMQAAKLTKGGGQPGRTNAGSITRAQLRQIAQEKMEDLNAATIDGAIKTLAGSARSMGIEVRD